MRCINIGLALAMTILGNQPLQAIQLADGTSYFAEPPSLVKAITTYRNPNVPSTYYFTLSLPANAGVPLQSVIFKQGEGLEDIAFDGAEAEIAGKKQHFILQKNHQSVSVTFDPPIAPGQTIKIGLNAINPFYGGIYLFGVTAFPVGEKSHGQFLGYGRLQFSTPGDRF
jgi:Protein of unknown function (DUF2808)